MKLQRHTTHLGMTHNSVAIPSECVCLFVWVCHLHYSRDFSHSRPVYLLYLQYNAWLSISDVETQVSICEVGARLCV